jgi:hypothetical protein
LGAALGWKARLLFFLGGGGKIIYTLFLGGYGRRRSGRILVKRPFEGLWKRN